MKSSTSRDAMNARVKEAFEKWPSFHDMPQAKKSGRRFNVSGDPDEQQNYIDALYACCNDGVPVGRDGAAIVAEPVSGDDEEMPAPPPRGHRLKAQPGQARQDGAALGKQSK